MSLSKSHVDIRKEIVENHRLKAIFSMPAGVFKLYAGASTAVIIFTKTSAGGTDNVTVFMDLRAVIELINRNAVVAR